VAGRASRYRFNGISDTGRISDESVITHEVLKRGEKLISLFTQSALRLLLVGLLLTGHFAIPACRIVL